MCNWKHCLFHRFFHVNHEFGCSMTFSISTWNLLQSRKTFYAVKCIKFVSLSDNIIAMKCILKILCHYTSFYGLHFSNKFKHKFIECDAVVLVPNQTSLVYYAKLEIYQEYIEYIQMFNKHMIWIFFLT